MATATAALPDVADDAAESNAADLMAPPVAVVPAPVAAATTDAAGTPAAAALESPEQQAVEAATKVSTVYKRHLQRACQHQGRSVMTLSLS